LASLLQTLNSVSDVSIESEVDKLVDSQASSTVRALLPLLRQPLPKTCVAAELRTRRTHDSILDVTEANKTFEDLVKICLGATLCQLLRR